MSRLTTGLASVLGLIAVTVSAPTQAQNAESAADRRVEDLLAQGRAQTDLRDPRCLFPEKNRGEIVVCAPADPDRFRYPGREDLESVQSTDNGIPRAPDVHGIPAIVGGIKIQGCFLQKCPEEIYLMDLASIPETPEGSDADRIGKGELAQP